jgi:hypothetical protein
MQGAAQGTRKEEQMKLAQLTGKAAATIAILQVGTERLLTLYTVFYTVSLPLATCSYYINRNQCAHKLHASNKLNMQFVCVRVSYCVYAALSCRLRLQLDVFTLCVVWLV